MSERSFAHLHLHTEYSMLDGAARIPDVVAAAAADGQPAVGLTDHGVLYGAVDFYQQATAAGLTPVIGMEGYLTAGSRFDRPPPRRGAISHNPAGGHPGGLQQPHQAGQHRLSRGLLLQAANGSRVAGASCCRDWWRRRGAWEGTSAAACPRCLRRGGQRWGTARLRRRQRRRSDVSGHLWERQLLRRSDGSRGGGAASCAPGPPPDLPGRWCTAARHQ